MYDPQNQQGQQGQPAQYGQQPYEQQYGGYGGGTVNNSGQGPGTPVPPEIQGWNWGAFLLSWIWGIGNSVMIALLALIPFVNLVMIFYLGAKGNELAWQNKTWDSVEHFKATQRKWALWGVGIFVGMIVLSCVCSLFGGILGAIGSSSSP